MQQLLFCFSHRSHFALWLRCISRDLNVRLAVYECRCVMICADIVTSLVVADAIFIRLKSSTVGMLQQVEA